MHNTKYSMKLRYLLTAFVATLAFAVGCVDQLPRFSFTTGIKFLHFYSPAGGSQTVTVKATEASHLTLCSTGSPSLLDRWSW